MVSSPSGRPRGSRVSEVDALGALADFDDLGGMSLELLAWEFCVAPTAIAQLWDQLLNDGLLRPGRPDPTTGEVMHRLSAGGWAAIRANERT